MAEIWSTLETFIETNFDRPMFQMGQGVILGLMIAIGIALIIKGFMREERQEKEEENDDRT